MHPNCLTHGIDHVGLSVGDLSASLNFFVECLGWRPLGENTSYPAAFVTDGSTRITLWRVSDPADFVPFDRHRNIGLHHLALRILTLDELHAAFAAACAWPGVQVELAPELSGKGPKVHAMIREPGGNRIELSWDPR
jgi:catechol 2,3-dioxygenase-like lactoylglutathione lyase family enzyme